MPCSMKFLSSIVLCLWLQTGCNGSDQGDVLSAFGVQDCTDLDASSESGVYTVFPMDDNDPIDVYCDQETDGGGWLVIQRRQDGSEDFYRNWETYLQGFGSLSGEFWLGNENIHRLTNQRSYQLRIDMEDFEHNKRYALYNYFSIGPVTDYYRLFLLGYSGDAGDSMSGHHNYQFTAKNLDKDTYSQNCAQRFDGAWWYSACHSSNLNGLYLNGAHSSYANGINWKQFKGYNYSLKKTEMKIRPMPAVLTQ